VLDALKDERQAHYLFPGEMDLRSAFQDDSSVFVEY
jgi:hypothetical protein